MARKKSKTPRKKTARSKSVGTRTKGAHRRKAVIRKDPLKEYAEAMKKSGVAELLEMSDDDFLCDVGDFISTQSVAIDKASGRPGVPVVRITEISGDEATGKSTLTDHIMAETQARGGVAALIDSEEAKDLRYTRSIGVNVDRLQILRPKRHTIEGVFDTLQANAEFWGKKYPDMLVTLVWDAVGATPSEAELHGEMTKIQPGVTQKQIRVGLRRLIPVIARTKICIVVVNHIYTKIGVTFGDPRVPYGGGGLRYHSTLRLLLSKGAAIKQASGQIIGQVIHCKVLKSKMSDATGAKPDFALMHGIGVDNTWSIYNRLHQEGYIQVSPQGGWYTMSLEGEKPIRWQGGFEGLSRLCQATESGTLFSRLLSLYQTLP